MLLFVKGFVLCLINDIIIIRRMMFMKYNIRGDKMVITPAIRDYVYEKVGRIDKYFNESDNVCVNVLAKVHGNNQIIEVTIPTKRFVLRAEEVHNDLYAAIDKVVDKLERQIRKNKTRIKKSNEVTLDFNLDYDSSLDEDEDNGKIVKRKVIETKPMDEEEAILQMEMLGHDFFIFRGIDDSISVLYKRKEGGYGLISSK